MPNALGIRVDITKVRIAICNIKAKLISLKTWVFLLISIIKDVATYLVLHVLSDKHQSYIFFLQFLLSDVHYI